MQKRIIRKLDFSINNIEKLIDFYCKDPYGIILDSSLNNNKLGEYSIIAFDPFLILKCKDKKIEIIDNKNKKRIINGEPLQYLKDLLKSYKNEERNTHIPFVSGCVGFLSYDLCRQIEEIPNHAIQTHDIDDIVLGFYNNSITIKHKTNEIYICVTSDGIDEKKDLNKFLEEKIKIIEKQLIEADKTNIQFDEEKTENEVFQKNIISNFSKEEYCEMIRKAKNYIKNGDIFQVNLSQKFSVKTQKNPIKIYKELRNRSKSPFAAYMNFGDLSILSNSPERFFRVNNRKIETRPIKGTIPRDDNKEQDEKNKQKLLNSEKDRAELTMIIDVQRNDLGRVCKLGTIKVESLFELEAYATVFHLVSTVVGILEDDIDVIDCIKAAFPGGSITGAPKIRAMEIIDELEKVRRLIYTGSIGYIDFNGDCDFNIAIRTIFVKDNEAFYNVGGGIVWDSVPEKEYEETLHKGKALMQTLGGRKSEGNK